MTDGKVKFTYFGDGKDLEKELVRLEKKHDDLENKIGQVSKKSRKSSQTAVQGLVAQVKGAANLSAAFDGVRRIISALTDEQRKFSRSIDETIPKLDEQQLKLQIQAGLTPKQVEGKIPQIKKSLLETPSADLSGAFQIQTQLVSSGFNQQDIDSGAALKTVLDLKAATNLFGEEIGNVKESVAAVAQFLKATGSDTSAANIRKIGGNLTQLFEGSDIQFADLGPLAGEAATLTSKGLSTDIQLAAFSALRDVKNAPEAATGFRQVVSRLSSAGESPAKVKALESIGLKPEDIDLIGEELPTALKRLKTAVEAVDEKTGRSAVFTLFGEKGESAGNALIGKLDVIDKRLEILRGGAFERNVKIFQESRYAERQRTGIRGEFAERTVNQQRGGVTFQDARQILQTKFAEDTANAKNFQDRLDSSLNTIIDAQGIAIGEGLGAGPRESYRFTQYAKDASFYLNPVTASNLLGEAIGNLFTGNPISKYSGKELPASPANQVERRPANPPEVKPVLQIQKNRLEPNANQDIVQGDPRIENQAADNRSVSGNRFDRPLSNPSGQKPVLQYPGNDLEPTAITAAGGIPGRPQNRAIAENDTQRIERKLDENRAVGERTNSLLEEQNNLLKQPGSRSRKPVNRKSQGE